MAHRPALRTRLVTALLVPAVLVVAGCGDDDPGPAATDEPSATADEPDPAATSTSPPTESPTDSPSEDPGADDDSLCRLLPQATAEELLGEPLEPGRQFDDECEWESPDQDRFIAVSRLDVGGYDWESVEQWSTAQTTGAHQPEPVDVGDEAYFSWIAPDLDMRVGEEVYQFEVALDEMSGWADPEEDKEAEKAVLVEAARAALDRL